MTSASRFCRWQLPELLRSQLSNPEDGRVELSVAGVRRWVWLEAGAIRAVASEAEEERLGEWLVARGALQPADLTQALAADTGARLSGTVLMDRGLISVERLRTELEARMVHVFSRLLPAEGEMRFEPGLALASEGVDLTTTVPALLAAAARAVDDELLQGALDERGHVTPSDQPCAPIHTLGLEPHEAYVLSRLDGRMRLEHLRKVLPLSHRDVTRAVVVLRAAGLAEVNITARPSGVKALDTPMPGRYSIEDLLSEEQKQERAEVRKAYAEMPFLDHYRRLGVARTASAAEIRAAFERQTAHFDPERVNEIHLRSLGAEMSEITTFLTEACAVLRDATRRDAYDRRLEEKEASARPAEPDDERRRQQARRDLVAANIARAAQLERAGDFGGAVVLLAKAAELQPDPETLLQLARVEFRNPMWSTRALDHLKQATEIDPRSTEAWLELAAFWARRRNAERQRQCLERVLEYDPVNETAKAALKGIRKH